MRQRSRRKKTSWSSRGSWNADMIQRILLGAVTSLSLLAQGGRGGAAIPALSEQQRAALMSMTSDLAPQAQAVTQARTALTASSFAAQNRSTAIHGAADAA